MIFDRLSTTEVGESGKIKHSDFKNIPIEVIDIYIGQEEPILWRLFYVTPPRPPPWADMEPPVREFLMYEVILPASSSRDEKGKPLDERIRLSVGYHLEDGGFMIWKTNPPTPVRVTVNPLSVRHDLLGVFEVYGGEY
jgi:hypothetical protein